MRSEGGYSLLEVLVVLAILGLSISVAYPSIDRSIERYRVNSILREIEAKVRQARASAYLQPAVITSDDLASDLRSQLADGWELSIDPELRFLTSGYCTGGLITIVTPARRERTVELISGRCNTVHSQRPGIRATGFSLTASPSDEN